MGFCSWESGRAASRRVPPQMKLSSYRIHGGWLEFVIFCPSVGSDPSMGLSGFATGDARRPSGSADRFGRVFRQVDRTRSHRCLLWAGVLSVFYPRVEQKYFQSSSRNGNISNSFLVGIRAGKPDSTSWLPSPPLSAWVIMTTQWLTIGIWWSDRQWLKGIIHERVYLSSPFKNGVIWPGFNLTVRNLLIYNNWVDRFDYFVRP